MIVIAFVLFAILIVAWLMAPAGERSAKPDSAGVPLLAASEAAAD